MNIGLNEFDQDKAESEMLASYRVAGEIYGRLQIAIGRTCEIEMRTVSRGFEYQPSVVFSARFPVGEKRLVLHSEHWLPTLWRTPESDIEKIAMAIVDEWNFKFKEYSANYFIARRLGR